MELPLSAATYPVTTDCLCLDVTTGTAAVCFLAHGAGDWSDRGLGEQSSGVHAKTGGSVPSFTDPYRWLPWLQRLTRVSLLTGSPTAGRAPPSGLYSGVGFHHRFRFLCITGNFQGSSLCALTRESPIHRNTFWFKEQFKDILCLL